MQLSNRKTKTTAGADRCQSSRNSRAASHNIVSRPVGTRRGGFQVQGLAAQAFKSGEPVDETDESQQVRGQLEL